MKWVKDIITLSRSWAEFQRILIIGSVVTVGASGVALGVGKLTAKITIARNTEQVNLNNTLMSLTLQQDDFQKSIQAMDSNITSMENKFNIFCTSEDQKYKDITQELNQTNKNLKFAVEQMDSMSARQIIKAFELGKKTVPMYYEGEPAFTPLDSFITMKNKP